MRPERQIVPAAWLNATALEAAKARENDKYRSYFGAGSGVGLGDNPDSWQHRER